MKKTRYFSEQVLRKRPYLRMDWIERVITSPIRSESQDDGRVRLWGWIAEQRKYLRVVMLEDGVTLHNAFFDRDFVPPTADESGSASSEE